MTGVKNTAQSEGDAENGQVFPEEVGRGFWPAPVPHPSPRSDLKPGKCLQLHGMGLLVNCGMRMP